jgi:hypothetical protein
VDLTVIRKARAVAAVAGYGHEHECAASGYKQESEQSNCAVDAGPAGLLVSQYVQLGCGEKEQRSGRETP